MNKKLFVISGSSGVGKGTVIERFLKKNPDFCLSISYTTRAIRQNETDGLNYFYITNEEFQKCIANDEFLEWAEFAGNLYGTKKQFVEQCLRDNRDVILEIDTKGALQVKLKTLEAVLIFIKPPSYEELETRLRGRQTEDEETIQKRLEIVREELVLSHNFDYIIVNDDLDNAVWQLENVIEGEKEPC